MSFVKRSDRPRRPAVRRLLTVVAVAAVVACADASTPPSERFNDRLREGAGCAELFELRNEAEPGSAAVERMNERLRSVGCHSSTSTRTDQ